MNIDIKNLIQLVKKSKLLSGEERSDWLAKLETMKEKDLKELQDILEYAENIDWDKAVAEYEAAVEKAERVCIASENKLQTVS